MRQVLVIGVTGVGLVAALLACLPYTEVVRGDSLSRRDTDSVALEVATELDAYDRRYVAALRTYELPKVRDWYVYINPSGVYGPTGTELTSIQLLDMEATVTQGCGPC